MSSRTIRSLLACGLVLALALAADGVVAQTEALSWQTVPSPNRGPLDNALNGISAVSATDIWAVGEWNPGVPPTETGRRTLVMHWNGDAWQIVWSPNPRWSGLDLATLEDVVALASDDVWAVGYSEDFASLRSNTLVMHWDGVQWKRVFSPNPAGLTLLNRVYGVDAVSPTSIWAVGEQGLDQEPLILHFNGTRWRVVPNGCQSGLRGVTVVSATDVWAVGDTTTCHFDGQSWQTVPSPQPRPQFNEIAYPLYDVSANGPDDVWAVGARVIDYAQYLVWLSIFEHWNGSVWTLMDPPLGQVVYGVEALAADDVWAVGTTGAEALILHWNGGTWSEVPAPSPGNGSGLADIVAVDGSNLWSVGSLWLGGTDRTLILHGAD